MGCDSDTNAAVTGALLGAKYGIASCHENWIKGVLAFDEYGHVCTRCAGLMELHDRK